MASNLRERVRNEDFTQQQNTVTDYGQGKKLIGSDGLAVGAAGVAAAARLGGVRAALLGELQGAEGDPHPLHGPLAPAKERILHVLPEVLGDEVVNKRIQAAVEAGQTQRGHVGAVQRVWRSP